MGILSIISITSTLVVAALQFLFLYMQMVVWQTSKGSKAFKLEVNSAQAFKTLALQQGLYNGFLGAGLIGSLLLADPHYSWLGRCFFLSCVLLAGLLGGLTAYRKILWLQACPALVALLLLLL